MDAVPVAVVVEAGPSCPDQKRAESALAEALAGARGPRRSDRDNALWRLRMTVAPAEAGTKVAAAQIRDDTGRLVAERTVSDKASGSCAALVSAVGAWAQIVLDDELVRVPDERSERNERSEPAQEQGHVERSASPPERAMRPRHAEVPADEAGTSSDAERVDSIRLLDLGSTVFLRNGAASSGALVGVSPFVAISLTDRWLLRPSLMYSTSTSHAAGTGTSGSGSISAFGGRLDLCGRIPGNYIHHRGIEFDLCMGGDVARVWSDVGSITRGSIGPAAALRGELGYDIGLEVRTVAGLAVNRKPIGDEGVASAFVTGVELGVSMRFE